MSLFINLAVLDLKSYLRNSYALFFTFLFPVLLLILLMLAFGGETGPSKTLIKISGDSPRAEKYLKDMNHILDNSKTIGFDIQKLNDENKMNSRSILVIIPNDTQQKISIEIGKNVSLRAYSSIYSLMLVNAMTEIDYNRWDHLLNLAIKTKSKIMQNFKYGQYLIPGIIGMILISTSLFSFSNFLVEQRAKGAFKAYHLYPLQKWKFIAAFAITRFLILVGFSIAFLILADKAYGMDGVFDLAIMAKLLVLISLGSLTFIAIALLIASRIMAVGVVTAVTNLVFFPATFASDLYIPQGGFPEIVKTIANIFPLGPFAEALRDITYHGANLSDISYALTLMAAWTVVCFIGTVILFKWTKD